MTTGLLEPQQSSADATPVDFRRFLQSELVRRCKQNPRYSQRAFSQFLNVENSWLSKVLRGERIPSAASVERLGLRLGLTPNQIESYKRATRSAKTQPSLQAKFLELTQDTFEVIAEWHHFAILELMKLDDFEPSTRWLAQRLGLSIHEVQAAIDRLVRVGILKIGEDQKWEDTSQGFTTNNLGINYTSFAHRALQQSILERSIGALQNVPISERDHSSTMMATSSEKLNEAKSRIDQFRHSLCAFLEDTQTRDTVYQLHIGLFPLEAAFRKG